MGIPICGRLICQAGLILKVISKVLDLNRCPAADSYSSAVWRMCWSSARLLISFLTDMIALISLIAIIAKFDLFFYKINDFTSSKDSSSCLVLMIHTGSSLLLYSSDTCVDFAFLLP